MRQLKFRAWDSFHNIMEYGDTPYMYLTHSERKIGIGFRLHHDFYHKNNECMFEKHITLMQYTGLKDKNGKEIYEGDILANEDGNLLVEFSNEYLGFFAGLEKGEFMEQPLYDITFPEVIGNIHENPELLT